MDTDVISKVKRKRHTSPLGTLYPVVTNGWTDAGTVIGRLQEVKAAQRNASFIVSLYPTSDISAHVKLLTDAMCKVADRAAICYEVAAKTAKAWEEVGKAIHEGLRVEMNKAKEHGTRAGE